MQQQLLDPCQLCAFRLITPSNTKNDFTSFASLKGSLLTFYTKCAWYYCIHAKVEINLRKTKNPDALEAVSNESVHGVNIEEGDEFC